MFPSNVCLCVQAAIRERLLHPENHQSADSAPPRAARLLWLPHNGWWRCVWELLSCCVVLCWQVTYLHLFCAQILFDNRAHSGKITVDVGTDVRIYECRDWNVEGTCEIYLKALSVVTQLYGVITATDLQTCDCPFTADKNDYLLLSFDSVVMLACFVSLILCLRSIIRGIQLQIVSEKKASISAQHRFLRLWLYNHLSDLSSIQ